MHTRTKRIEKRVENFYFLVLTTLWCKFVKVGMLIT